MHKYISMNCTRLKKNNPILNGLIAMSVFVVLEAVFIAVSSGSSNWLNNILQSLNIFQNIDKVDLGPMMTYGRGVFNTFMDTPLLTLFVVLSIVNFLVGDSASNVMKNIIRNDKNRSEYIIATSAWIILSSLLFLIVYLIETLLLTKIFNIMLIDNLDLAFKQAFVLLLGFSALTSLAYLLVVLLKRKGFIVAMIVLVCLGIPQLIVGSLLSLFSLEAILDYSIMSIIQKVPLMTVIELPLKFILCLPAYYIIFNMMNCVIFSKKDIG